MCLVYVHYILSNFDIFVSLLTSKTGVSTLKTQPLSRLELCTQLLLPNVLQMVLKGNLLSFQNYMDLKDYTITLTWVSTELYRWQRRQ